MRQKKTLKKIKSNITTQNSLKEMQKKWISKITLSRYENSEFKKKRQIPFFVI